MDDKIIIPYGLTMEQEYFPGFGSCELRQFLIGGAAFGWTLGAFTAYCALAIALTAAVLAGKITHQKRLPLAPFLCVAGMAMILGHI